MRTVGTLLVTLAAAGTLSTQHLVDAGKATVPPDLDGATRRLLTFDFDADGDLDVLVGNDPLAVADPAVSRLLENDRGRFVTRAEHREDLVLLADLDGDGRPDVLDGAGGVLGVTIAGAFVPRGALPVAGTIDAGVAADFDGDSRIDLLLLAGSPPRALLLLQTTSGVFSDSTAAAGLAGVSGDLAAAADIDGDLDADLVIAVGGEFRSGPNRLFVNNGSAVFTDASSRIPPRPVRTTDLLVEDLDADGDGDRDLLQGAPLFENRIWFNDGAAQFVGPSDAGPGITSIAPRPGQRAIPGDFDGDVVMAGVRYENDGHARFRTVLASGPSSGVAGDADRDGDLDLFLGTRSAVPWSGEPDQLWRNDGTAGFTVDATWIATGSAARESVEVETGDLNGDGRIDAAVSGATAGGGSVYLSRSDGRFDVRAIPPNGYPARLAAGDLDGDGDVDLAAATWCSSIPQCGGWADEVLWNDGAGNFTAAALPSDTEAGDVALLDVDLDGHIEVFVAARERGLSAQDALLLNQGGGVFAAAVPGFDHPVDHGEATQLVTADFDADGDDDLLVVNEPRGVAASMMLFPRTRLLLGTGRHLRAPDLARLGKPYELTIHGGASGAALLFAPRLGHTPVPPIGVLGLDTASLALVTAFGPGPVPRAYRLTVPNVPALAGGAAHWQALVQDAGFRLTNVEYDTVIVH